MQGSRDVMDTIKDKKKEKKESYQIFQKKSDKQRGKQQKLKKGSHN